MKKYWLFALEKKEKYDGEKEKEGGREPANYEGKNE